VTPEQRIDAALDSVLKASGSALRHYTMPKTLADMREAMRKVMSDAYIKGSNDAIANATGDDDAAPECTCAAKDMTFGRCCKLTPNKCKWCGHDIHAHDKQYGCAEDGCDCETPNTKVQPSNEVASAATRC